jgi:hypothetical protein
MPSAVSSGKQAMQGPGPVTEYLDSLTREFGFDTALSQRARNEIEDHLWESIAHEAGVDSIEDQYRAIARFGDPREIARQYAASSLLSQTRCVGFIALLALMGIYIAMRGRGAWYGLVQWGLSDHLKEITTTWVSIDHNAFRIALAIGIIGLGYIGSRRAPISFHEGYRKQVMRCVVLCAATAGALLASVVADGILTGLRLFEASLPASGLIPILSVAVEIVLVGALVLHIRTTIRRIAFASALLQG